MQEYYGLDRSECLAHYGVRGMKWGVRKALSNKVFGPKTKAFSNAEKKLSAKQAQGIKRATVAGGLIGGLAYAASTHKKNGTVKNRSLNINLSANAPKSKKTVEERPLNMPKRSSQPGLKKQALTAAKKADAALAERNRHLTGSFANSKYNKAYQQARQEAKDAYGRYLSASSKPAKKSQISRKGLGATIVVGTPKYVESRTKTLSKRR